MDMSLKGENINYIGKVDALGKKHKNDLKKLHIKPENCRVFHEKNHFDLLDDERVHKQIVDWFRAA